MKMGVRHYRNLDAWNAAIEMTLSCYALARQLPPDERFALAAQMRRAAVSVPSNVAEGQALAPTPCLRNTSAALWVRSASSKPTSSLPCGWSISRSLMSESPWSS